MKHLRKAEQKCSETAAYRYFVGGLLVLLDGLKNVCKRLIRHTTELLIVASILGMVAAANAFDSEAINYTTAILFIIILIVLIATLIKVKILECRGDKK